MITADELLDSWAMDQGRAGFAKEYRAAKAIGEKPSFKGSAADRIAKYDTYKEVMVDPKEIRPNDTSSWSEEMDGDGEEKWAQEYAKKKAETAPPIVLHPARGGKYKWEVVNGRHRIRAAVIRGSKVKAAIPVLSSKVESLDQWGMLIEDDHQKEVKISNLIYKVKNSNGVWIRVYDAGNEIAHFGFADDDQGVFGAFSSFVDPKYRRKGIASHAYDIAEKESGKKLSPAVLLSPEIQSFWSKRGTTPGESIDQWGIIEAENDWKKKGITISDLGWTNHHKYEMEPNDEGEKAEVFRVIAKNGSKQVAVADIGTHPDAGGLVAWSIKVDTKFRRMGIASAMYRYAEKKLSDKMEPFPGGHSKDAQMLWTDPNRKFGDNYNENIDRLGVLSELTVYHGSRKQFDKFSLDYAGSDQGTNIAWGLYFSETPKGAEFYKSLGKKEGRLYTVQIPDGPYLNWNNPLSMQKDILKIVKDTKNFKDADERARTQGFLSGGQLKGSEFYGSFQPYQDMEPKEISAYLYSLGIIGVKYRHEDYSNYILFNAGDAKILKTDESLEVVIEDQETKYKDFTLKISKHGPITHRIIAYTPDNAIAGFADIYSQDKLLMPSQVKVNEKYRRQGLATAMYQFAETVLNRKMKPSVSQTPDAEKFWSQSNRPFGESFDQWGVPLRE